MTDEKIEERFGEIQDQINAYTKRIKTLEEDLRIVIRFGYANVVEQARLHAANAGVQSQWANPPPDDPVFRERCREFAEKYGSDR
jgi:hypothetical protein